MTRRTLTLRILGCLALAGHLLTAWAGPWLHDHGHALGDCTGAACEGQREPAGHHCCHHHGHSHKHAARSAADGASKSHGGPCHHRPGEDANCPVCQILANAPHPAAPVALPTTGEPLSEPAATARPRLSVTLAQTYRSRAPPTA